MNEAQSLYGLRLLWQIRKEKTFAVAFGSFGVWGLYIFDSFDVKNVFIKKIKILDFIGLDFSKIDAI